MPRGKKRNGEQEYVRSTAVIRELMAIKGITRQGAYKWCHRNMPAPDMDYGWAARFWLRRKWEAVKRKHGLAL